MAFISEEDMLQGSPLAGWSGRFFHSANMTFARWTIAEGASDLHRHQHEQEEVWNVVSGSVVLIVAGVERRVEAGDAAIVPPNTPHSVRVVGAAEAVVTDFPLREQLPGVPEADWTSGKSTS
jgi:mannose-6-phosphate isomerase-like protein (cupin superfamily)